MHGLSGLFHFSYPAPCLRRAFRHTRRLVVEVMADVAKVRPNRVLKRIRLRDVQHTYATTSLDAGVDPKIVADRIGHANMAYTLAIYTNPRELHQAGVKTAGQQVTGSPELRSARHEDGTVTWEDPAVLPSDARSAHQGACTQRESQKRSDEGTREFVAWVRRPGGAFSGFQYLTVPLSRPAGTGARPKRSRGCSWGPGGHARSARLPTSARNRKTGCAGRAATTEPPRSGVRPDFGAFSDV